MSVLDKAVQSQIQNIQARTGKSLADFTALIESSGLTKHGEIRQMLIDRFSLGYGDANALTHAVRQSDGTRSARARGLSTDAVFDELYAGKKANLRPIHDRLMAAIEGFGEFEIVPKKNYVSLRRKKQFAMIGPPTNSRVDVGLNVKGLAAHSRITVMPAGGMCNVNVHVTTPDEVDALLIGWIKQAYDSAG